MVPIGLCLLALICVALGLTMTNAAWFFAAIALVVLALVAIAQRRSSVGRLHRNPATLADDVDEPLDDAVWVIDGRPRYHAHDCVLVKEWDSIAIERVQAVEDSFVPCKVCRQSEQASEAQLGARDQQG